MEAAAKNRLRRKNWIIGTAVAILGFLVLWVVAGFLVTKYYHPRWTEEVKSAQESCIKSSIGDSAWQLIKAGQEIASQSQSKLISECIK